MEQMQRNMEASLRNIADNTRRGDNQGGREVNQYNSFKDFMDTKHQSLKRPWNHLRWMNGLTPWSRSFVSFS